MCTGCMECLRDRKPEYFNIRDSNEWTAQEAVDWFCSPWDFFLAMIKHADLFAGNSEEFVRAHKVIGEDEVAIYWDDGLMSYPRDEVEEWTASDFGAYLGLSVNADFISVMERENRGEE